MYGKLELTSPLAHTRKIEGHPYIGCRVLILMDISYLSRFWTQTESWISMQEASALGLTTASEVNRRFTIVPLHNAAGATGIADSLVAMWAGKTPCGKGCVKA